MDIYSFKLTSGEEIIAKIVTQPEDDDGPQDYVIEAPMVIMLAEVGSSVIPIPVSPWILLAQKTAKIPLREDLIMYVNKSVPKSIEDHYIQQTTTIVMP